ncbi:hypothetical protein ABEB36_013015 [Hypothenemus hampei]|uniref:Uncharacterized protein n=1 Tax=Hypothenemus hampei TaxID=57062 RepID=A0ABD1E6J1_HYPHA
MNVMQRYDQFVSFIFENIKDIIRYQPFISIGEIAHQFLEAKGCPFQKYGLGPLETVLTEIPGIDYVTLDCMAQTYLKSEVVIRGNRAQWVNVCTSFISEELKIDTPYCRLQPINLYELDAQHKL